MIAPHELRRARTWWHHSTVEYTLPRLAYSGPMLQPHDMRDNFPGQWNQAFVYHVFNDEGDLLYVGFTRNPFGRWEKHRLKAQWWVTATHLNLYLVEGKDWNCADIGARHWESRAIHGARPLFNLHGPAHLPAKLARARAAAVTDAAK